MSSFIKPLLFATGAAAAAGGAACVIGARYLFNKVIPRQDGVQVDTSEMADAKKWDEYIVGIRAIREKLQTRPSEHVTIKSRDGLTLHGDLFMAQVPTKRTVITFHGYTSCGINDTSNMAEYFMQRGYNALIVDQRSHGKSEGEYIGFGILDRYDCINWIQYITERLGEDIEIVLYGVSMGGATVLMASGFDDFPKSVKAIVADCAFTSPYEVFVHILKRDYHLPPHPIMDINDKMCRDAAGYGFKDYSTLDAVRKAPCPYLFIHGREDMFVPTEMSVRNYQACPGEKQLLLVDNAGHAAALYENRELYYKTVDEFLDKYGL